MTNGALATESAVGLVLPAFTAVATRRNLQLFADVVGESDRVYIDLDTALAAGYPDIPVPLTFLFSLEYERPDPHGVLLRMGVDLRAILHAEQEFVYHAMAFAGQELEFRPRIVETYEKKGGALLFIVRETQVLRGDELVAELRNTVVERR